MQATETKKQLHLNEPEAALTWIVAFKARCWAEKKAYVPPTGTTSADLQVTDQFLFRCGVENLMKVKLLVAPTKVETMAFFENETGLENCLQPRKRLVIAEQTTFEAITQRNGESAGDFLACLKEVAGYCEFGNLKTIADPEAYMMCYWMIYCWITKFRTHIKSIETSSTKRGRYNRRHFAGYSAA